jgi:hypothetical protein
MQSKKEKEVLDQHIGGDKSAIQINNNDSVVLGVQGLAPPWPLVKSSTLECRVW